MKNLIRASLFALFALFVLYLCHYNIQAIMAVILTYSVTWLVATVRERNRNWWIMRQVIDPKAKYFISDANGFEKDLTYSELLNYQPKRNETLVKDGPEVIRSYPA